MPRMSKLSRATRELLVDLCQVLPSAKKALKKFDALHQKKVKPKKRTRK